MRHIDQDVVILPSRVGRDGRIRSHMGAKRRRKRTFAAAIAGDAATFHTDTPTDARERTTGVARPVTTRWKSATSPAETPTRLAQMSANRLDTATEASDPATSLQDTAALDALGPTDASDTPAHVSDTPTCPINRSPFQLDSTTLPGLQSSGQGFTSVIGTKGATRSHRPVTSQL